MIDFVTIAPSSVSGKNCESSFPEPAHPLAVKIGFERVLEDNFVEKSNIMHPMFLPEFCADYPKSHWSHP